VTVYAVTITGDGLSEFDRLLGVFSTHEIAARAIADEGYGTWKIAPVVVTVDEVIKE